MNGSPFPLGSARVHRFRPTTGPAASPRAPAPARAVIAHDAGSRVFVPVAISGDVFDEAAAYRLLMEVQAHRAPGKG